MIEDTPDTPKEAEENVAEERQEQPSELSSKSEISNGFLTDMMPRPLKEMAENYAAKKRAADEQLDKEEKKGKEKPQKKTNAIDEIDAAIAASEYKEYIKKKRKKQITWGGIAGIIIFIAYWIWTLFMPYKGSVFYGVCKTFLELYVPYPETLQISVVDEIGTFVRIWYAHTDSFGSYRLEPMVCHFERNEETGMWLIEKITVDRQELPHERIEEFNRIVPMILLNPQDLTLPWPLPDKIENLRFDQNSFIRPIL